MATINNNWDGSVLVTRNDGQTLTVAAGQQATIDTFLAADTLASQLSQIDPALKALGQLLIQKNVITKAEAKAALASAGVDLP